MSNARASQVVVLAAGAIPSNARASQVVVLVAGQQAVDYTFSTGGVVFYQATTIGAELVPIPSYTSVVVSGNGMVTGATQTMTTDGNWGQWTPADGALEVSFSNGNPVNTIYFPKVGVYSNPVAVWASSEALDPYKEYL